jgi:hypothetical protein
MIMDTVERAKKRLREHSGLGVTQQQFAENSLAVQVREALRNGVVDNLTSSVTDILECLSQVNHHLFSSPTGSANAIDRDIAYSVSGIVCLLCELSLKWQQEPHERIDAIQRLLFFLWEINCAWDAVLAGDIEDVQQHLRWETAAKFD